MELLPLAVQAISVVADTTLSALQGAAAQQLGSLIHERLQLHPQGAQRLGALHADPRSPEQRHQAAELLRAAMAADPDFAEAVARAVDRQAREIAMAHHGDGPQIAVSGSNTFHIGRRGSFLDQSDRSRHITRNGDPLMVVLAVIVGVLVAAGAAFLLLSGSGSSDEEKAEKVTLDFVEAFALGDVDTACHLLTDEGKRRVSDFNETAADICVDPAAAARYRDSVAPELEQRRTELGQVQVSSAKKTSDSSVQVLLVAGGVPATYTVTRNGQDWRIARVEIQLPR